MRRRRKPFPRVLPSLLLLFLQVCCCLWEPGFAFLSPDGRRFRSMLQAKPPPICQFDLEAIEEFESSLLLQTGDNTAATGDLLDDDETDNVDAPTFFSWQIPPELDKTRIDAALASLSNGEWSRSYCGNTLIQERPHWHRCLRRGGRASCRRVSILCAMTTSRNVSCRNRKMVAFQCRVSLWC